MGAVLGISPWMTPAELWRRKYDAAPIQEEKPEDMDEWREMGLVLEGSIIDHYAVRTGRETVTPAALLGASDYLSPRAAELAESIREHARIHFQGDGCEVIFQSLTERWALATPDFFAYDEQRGSWGVVDAKNVVWWKEDQWTESTPAHYLAQNHHYANVLGPAFGWVGWALLIGGNRYLVVDEDLDPNMLAACRVEGARFVRSLEEGTIPDTIPSSTSLPYLSSLERVAVDPEPVVPPERIELEHPEKGLIEVSHEGLDKLWLEAQAARKLGKELGDACKAAVLKHADGAQAVDLPSECVRYQVSVSHVKAHYRKESRRVNVSRKVTVQ